MRQNTPVFQIRNIMEVTHVLTIEGMSCNNFCTPRVQKALSSVPGVASVIVSLEAGEANITAASNVDVNDLLSAVAGAGYKARCPKFQEENKREEETTEISSLLVVPSQLGSLES